MRNSAVSAATWMKPRELRSEIASDETTDDGDASNAPLPGYHSWKGNNIICCQGRVIGGSEIWKYLGSLSGVIVPSAIFLILIAPKMMKYELHYQLIIQLALILFCVVCLSITAFMDPGIIPRDAVPLTNVWLGPQPYIQLVTIAGKRFEYRFCGTCHSFRPPRTFHCRTCNNCVERFDHHCPWIGNCIGRRNYGCFTGFVNGMQLLSYWSLACLIWVIYHDRKDLAQKSRFKEKSGNELTEAALRKNPIAIVLGIFVFCGMCFVATLAWFHWFLVWHGLTTTEFVRDKSHNNWNDWDRGLFRNVIDMCCITPPKQIHIAHTPLETGNNALEVNKTKVVFLTGDQVMDYDDQGIQSGYDSSSSSSDDDELYSSSED